MAQDHSDVSWADKIEELELFDSYGFVMRSDLGYTTATRVLHPKEVVGCVRLFLRRCPTESTLVVSIDPNENPFLFLTEWRRENSRQIGKDQWLFQRSK